MELRTERLILREFHHEDWQVVHTYQNTPRYLLYYPWHQRSEDDVRAFVQHLIDWQDAVPRIKFQLAIAPLDAGGALRDLIGNCGIRMYHPDATEADLGYEIAPDHWGQGYATEAAAAMVEFGFGGLGLHRIWAECIASNRASARVLEKLGMQQEGRLREKRWMKGRWWDVLIYGILASEW